MHIYILTLQMIIIIHAFIDLQTFIWKVGSEKTELIQKQLKMHGCILSPVAWCPGAKAPGCQSLQCSVVEFWHPQGSKSPYYASGHAHVALMG